MCLDQFQKLDTQLKDGNPQMSEGHVKHNGHSTAPLQTRI